MLLLLLLFLILGTFFFFLGSRASNVTSSSTGTPTAGTARSTSDESVRAMASAAGVPIVGVRRQAASARRVVILYMVVVNVGEVLGSAIVYAQDLDRYDNEGRSIDSCDGGYEVVEM